MPDRPALRVDDETISYRQLRASAASIAATLQQQLDVSAGPLTAVFAERSRTAFAGTLGALLAGHAYVPLNPGFPIARTQRMLQQAGCASVVIDSRTEPRLGGLLDGLDRSLLVVLPDNTDVSMLRRRWPAHAFVGANELTDAATWLEPHVSDESLAYLLFTSGSTGIPKGVGVTHRNIAHFIGTMVERYDISCEDRFSQMFEMTFDLSVFDMFVAWHRGACVYCPTRATLLNPDRFIRQHELTIWFSVPTVALLMKRIGALKPARYPSLRWSLFCGEPLPVELAEAWNAAAPASTLENLYGPTELTVACTAYRWDPAKSRQESSGGLVPIGFPYPGMVARVVDERLCDVVPGEVGELVMAGPQRTPGYWGDAEATARSFVRLDGSDDVFYRTGDRVRQPGPDAPLQYVGRMDHQIKVMGHRVELGEVESLLRQQPGVQDAVALGWPPSGGSATEIAAFVTGTDIDVADVRARMQTILQAYAVPKTIRVLSAFPQNANGKVDRQALLRFLTG